MIGDHRIPTRVETIRPVVPKKDGPAELAAFCLKISGAIFAAFFSILWLAHATALELEDKARDAAIERAIKEGGGNGLPL